MSGENNLKQNANTSNKTVANQGQAGDSSTYGQQQNPTQQQYSAPVQQQPDSVPQQNPVQQADPVQQQQYHDPVQQQYPEQQQHSVQQPSAVTQQYPYQQMGAQGVVQAMPDATNVGQPQVPQQQVAQASSFSPEAPARVESGEYLPTPELGTEQEKVVDKREAKRVEEAKTEGKKEEVETGTPDQKKFENPFRVYGYQVSKKMAALGKKLSGRKVRGDTSSAKTWLVILLERLLRIYKGEAYKPS